MEKKKLFRIGTVAKLLGLKTYVLRFWETQYPQVVPLRSESGQRLYSEKQVALLGRIKQLIREQGMTTAGVRRVLSGKGEDVPALPLDLEDLVLQEDEASDTVEENVEQILDPEQSDSPLQQEPNAEEALQHAQTLDAIRAELGAIRTLLLRNEEGA